MGYFQQSGFAAVGHDMPQRTSPRDWIAWHFTHVENLTRIAADGYLYAGSRCEPAVNVALQGVKHRRSKILVTPDNDYPQYKSVADHVPFYLAARSPMLYAVTYGHDDYIGGASQLVFLGIHLAAVIDSGLEWCVSDANAATDLVSFTREVDGIGSFVDFDLLCQKMWSKTPEDVVKNPRRSTSA